MRSKAIGSAMMLVSILIIFSACVLPVQAGPQAQPLAQQREVQITSPETNAELRGVVVIVGSAASPNFQFYKIEFGVGPNPNQWAIIGSIHEQPVVNGQLEAWDTTGLPDGVYSLRLQVVKKDGNYDEFFLRQLLIANTRPAGTETPTETPTLSGGENVTATPRPDPSSVITPQATSTVQFIAPTAALSRPTTTPTLVRAVQQEQLPIEPRSWGQAFCFGAAAMGIVFVVLGIVFGLRRLL